MGEDSDEEQAGNPEEHDADGEEVDDGGVPAWLREPPPNLVGLPRGLRMRSSAAQRDPQRPSPLEALEGGKAQSSTGSGLLSAGVPVPSRRQVWVLGLLFAACLLMTAHFLFRQVTTSIRSPRHGCRQCESKWWDDFWRWRFRTLDRASRGDRSRQTAPEGMEWEWGDSLNNTDWYGASPELVDSLVRKYVEPDSGPLLQIGCGDSPLPALLYTAGYRRTEHIDIAPQVIEAMRRRYPPVQWPGLTFEVRDFLAPVDSGGGAPPPLHRFAAVIDKAGLWDWLQEEAPGVVPRLLAAVREALLPGAHKGMYILATKQAPAELAATLSSVMAQQSGQSGFAVEVTHALGNSGVAWAYVLSPF